MRRCMVPAILLAAAGAAGVHAWPSVVAAHSHLDVRHVLLALNAVLRTAIALAFAVCTIGRAAPRSRARDPLAYVACVVAMGAVVVMAGPTQSTSPTLLAAGDGVAVGGCLWTLVSVLALGRCFGVLPEARGLVRRGPYRFVRHPVYLGEITALAGLTVAVPVPRNVGLLFVLVGAQMARARFEERALSEAFPEYASYMQTTGRLFPTHRQRATAVAAVPE
jgi:protein-S-isoprenylcysteine O-methyltransferase Ste14